MWCVDDDLIVCWKWRDVECVLMCCGVCIVSDKWSSDINDDVNLNEIKKWHEWMLKYVMCEMVFECEIVIECECGSNVERMYEWNVNVVWKWIELCVMKCVWEWCEMCDLMYECDWCIVMMLCVWCVFVFVMVCDVDW